MHFSQQQLNEMSQARRAIGGKYETLLMKYVMLPLKNETARNTRRKDLRAAWA